MFWLDGEISMPIRELSIVDQREEFVRLALMPGANRSELCRRFGLSRSKAYKWLARYVLEGAAGLCDRSRQPHHSPTRTAAKVEARVLRIRKSSNNCWGGRKIAHVLHRRGGAEVPAPSTITEILRRHGKLKERAEEHPGACQRFERCAPNELWQMDFKGDFAIGRGRCHTLTVIDDHSRYALGLEACGTQQDQPTRERLVGVFRRYGLPNAMLMDNGAPWGDSGGGPFTGFGVWLLRLGVRVTHGRPYHPQTQGKDERFHRTLKAEVLQGQWFRDLAECQRAYNRWRHVYNHERPHQALGMATPSERYLSSRRPFPEVLPPIEYGPDDIIRKADVDGDIRFKARRIRLGKPFRGQPIALRPAAKDGLFGIHFCAHQIGLIDLNASTPLACGFVDIARAMPTSPTGQTATTEPSNCI
jgi:transposase InsO family protein